MLMSILKVLEQFYCDLVSVGVLAHLLRIDSALRLLAEKLNKLRQVVSLQS